MKLIAAFFRLIRVLNLLFIVVTQVLFQYSIVVPMMSRNPHSPALPVHLFALLSLSSVLIAAAGYIINDYFDLNIDRINKPGRVVVEKVIKRRWAIVWHWVLSFFGVCFIFCNNDGNIFCFRLERVGFIGFFYSNFKRNFGPFEQHFSSW